MTPQRCYNILLRDDAADLVGIWRLDPEWSIDRRFEFRQTHLAPHDPPLPWTAPRVSWVTDGATSSQTLDFSFLGPLLVAHETALDRPVCRALSLTGEWLPLVGQGDGFAVLRPYVRVEIDEERSVWDGKRLPGGRPRRIVFQQPDRLPVGLAFIGGFGVVWFEGDTSVRNEINLTETSGFGFYRIWDASGTWDVPSITAIAEGHLWE